MLRVCQCLTDFSVGESRTSKDHGSVGEVGAESTGSLYVYREEPHESGPSAGCLISSPSASSMLNSRG